MTLEGFYQSGTSTVSGNPSFSLETQNIDPWMSTCWPSGAADTSNRTTRIDLISTTRNLGPTGTWSPAEGDVTTTDDGCASNYCDFTISGSNTNASQNQRGSAEGNFTLRLRLEYPVPEPDTKITRTPKKRVKTKTGKAMAAFAFKSTGSRGTKFRCRLDKARFAPCKSPFRRKVSTGKHRFAVAAVYRGKADPTPAVYRWKVKKTP